MAAIERRVSTSGAVSWRVRWRHAGQKRSQTFDRLSDARNFAADMRLRQQRGQLDTLNRGEVTLREYTVEVWAPTKRAELGVSTRQHYHQLIKKHIEPFLGTYSLRDLKPETIRRWQAERISDHAGAESLRKARTLLGSILQQAVEGEYISANPVRAVKPSKRPRPTVVRPIAPKDVEALRAAALRPSGIEVEAARPGQRQRTAYAAPAPGTAYTRHRDATLISVLAYAGLRPQEALTLQWQHVQERTILVYAPKTDTTRSVRLLPPLATDLLEFRMASGRPDGDALIFPDTNGDIWSKGTWDNWRKRTFARVLKDAGLGPARPYDLRHSFASLLAHEGRQAAYIAKQLGHSVLVSHRVYEHVIDELEDAPQLSAADAIAEARSGVPVDRPVRTLFSS